MSFDYDRLRELLEQWAHGDEVRDQLEAQWDMELAAPDMARELIRLRDGIEALRDVCTSAATVCRSSNDPDAPAVASNLESVARALTDLLTGLLNGDPE